MRTFADSSQGVPDCSEAESLFIQSVIAMTWN